MKTTLRKCVGCQKLFDKNTLLRVVKNEQGAFVADETGKYQSRGAYVCRDLACVNLAAKKKAFERAFKCPVNKSVYDDLKTRFCG